jgi:hypothetical protein
VFFHICVICGVFISLICGSGCGRSFHFSKLQTAGVLKEQQHALIAGRRDLRVGEKLTYEIRWMGIPVGIASFNVKEIERVNERDCYHIVATVRSNSFLSKIYRVEDEFQTYIDKEMLYSHRFIKKQAEGRYRSQEIVNYDQDKHTGIYKSLLNNSTKELIIPEKAQDDLSAIYYFRMQDIDVPSAIAMNVNADEKNWLLRIEVLRKGIMNLPRIGNLEAIEVEPSATRTDGKPLKKGRIWLWFGADENRIPLAAKANAPIVGTVSAVLTQIE